MRKSSRTALTSSMPKVRKTPATIAITIGIGTAAIALRTSPDRPSTRISAPVTMKAPITSGQVSSRSALPTRIVPGMVQANPSGWR